MQLKLSVINVIINILLSDVKYFFKEKTNTKKMEIHDLMKICTVVFFLVLCSNSQDIFHIDSAITKLFQTPPQFDFIEYRSDDKYIYCQQGTIVWQPVYDDIRDNHFNVSSKEMCGQHCINWPLCVAVGIQGNNCFLSAKYCVKNQG